jgi:hypothetical protein
MELEVEGSLGIELATLDDMKEMHNQYLEAAKVPYYERVQYTQQGLTDATGNLGLRVYDVPDGKTFFLYKLIQWADGFTPAKIFASANGWTGIFHGNQPSAANLADFAPYTPGNQIFPLTAEYNETAAPEFRQNDNLFFQVNAGPISTNISVLIFGELRDLRVRNKFAASRPFAKRGMRGVRFGIGDSMDEEGMTDAEI